MAAIPIADRSGYEETIGIPSRVWSKDGQLIDTSSDVWEMRVSADGVGIRIIKWTRLHQVTQKLGCPERTGHLVKRYLADRIPGMKTLTVYNDYEAFFNFFTWVADESQYNFSRDNGFTWSHFDEEIARQFIRWSIDHRANQGNDFFRIRTFYKWGVAQKLIDFSQDMAARLVTIRPPGNITGHLVRSRDPLDGPLSPDEIGSLAQAIRLQKGTDQDRAVVMIHLELGLNPNATARLKVNHLKRFQADDKKKYQLAVPRVKKRTSYLETRQRPISNQLGMLLEGLMQGDSENLLLFWLDNGYPEATIRRAMRQFVKDANIITLRSGELLRLTPRRLRYSLATHLAAEGASKLLIADVLDHSTLGTADTYTATVSSIALYVAQSIDPALGPIVDRFLGNIIDSLTDKVFDNIPNQIIPGIIPLVSTTMLSVAGVGVCGKNVRKDGLCRLFPPLSCYLCPDFHALRSGPHQEVLQSIEAFINGSQGNVSERVLAQLDHVRMAIVQVIHHLGMAIDSQDNNTHKDIDDE